jgi:hypothetical protein
MSKCFFPFKEVNMSTHHAPTHHRFHLAEHRGLEALLVLASLAFGVIAVIAVLSTVQPATVTLAPSNALAAEQARVEFRRGEWAPLNPAPAAALDQHERHANIASRAAAAETARLSFRQGEWNMARDAAVAAERARLEFRRGEWSGQ